MTPVKKKRSMKSRFWVWGSGYLLGRYLMREDERLGFSSLGVKKVGPTLGKASDLRPLRCTSLPLASLWEIAEEAMNFMSYVAEVSRGWDEPNARDMGRMTSQPNAKGRGRLGGAQKSINAHLSQRIDSVESSLNKKMDGIQNDLSQKIDNLQYSISRFANLNKVQEKGNFPSQPHQNSKGIHEVEAKKGKSLMVKEVKAVITLRSGKEVDLPTSKLEHDEESETEKEKREEIKGKRKGKSTEKDGYDVNVQGKPQRIVIKEEMMKKHMPPLFPQALYGKIIQSKSQVRDANFIWDPGKLNQDQIF
uniref:Uncharacterized protein n=1 Tax=Vitis vinifera TaxID=29760 RepID=A5BUS0_VITVI|nr:hypothetical protein VITISV_021375 [Vitis vinifera]